MSEAVKVERHGAVAVVRLDDPRVMNARHDPAPALRMAPTKRVCGRLRHANTVTIDLASDLRAQRRRPRCFAR